ncbi:MAG: MgtC/SapB family protein [Novipirellula sp. JB048]
MDGWIVNHEIFGEFGTHFVRLLTAVLLGATIGVERQFQGRWAGMRTHMMVSLGAAIFTLAAITTTPEGSSEITRVIQGIAAGIGFLGAGTIVKLGAGTEVAGLTTASSIWMAAALGTVSGMGEYALAVTACLFSMIVLALLRPITKPIGNDNQASPPKD